jgi:hypothetical protein
LDHLRNYFVRNYFDGGPLVVPVEGQGCEVPVEPEVPAVPFFDAVPVVDEDEVPALAPAEGETEPGAVCELLLLPAIPVVPVEFPVVLLLPVVPAIVPQLPLEEVELLGFVIEG